MTLVIGVVVTLIAGGWLWLVSKLFRVGIAMSQRIVSEALISAARRRACSSQSRSVALKKPTADW